METTIAKKLEVFFTQFKHQRYKKGEILIRADDNPPGIFYLKEGTVKKYAISQSGEEVILNIFKPVSFFPMSWAINETPNSYFYEAKTDCEIWKAPKDEVIKFIKQNPDVLFDLMSRVYKGTDGLEARLKYLMSGSAYTRLITELIIQAKRFGKINGQTVELAIAESELAADTGMTRETISREMKILKEKNLLTLSSHKLIIKDLRKLEAELAEY